MGTQIYIGTVKGITAFDCKTGREVSVRLANWACKAGDEKGYYGILNEREQRLLNARIEAAQIRHGDENAPAYWVFASHKQSAVKEGNCVHPAEGRGSFYDDDMKYGGTVKQVVGRDGKKCWVVFPPAKCGLCEDTGYTVHGGASGFGPGSYAYDTGDVCPKCGGPAALESAMAKGERRQAEEAARKAAEQRAAAERAAARQVAEAVKVAEAAKAKLEAARREYEAALNAAAAAGVR